MKYFLFFTLLFTVLFSNAQELNAETSVGTITSMSDIFSKHLKGTVKDEIIGNPFLYDNWLNKGVVYSKGKSYAVKNINYNIYSDNVGSLKGKDSVLVYNKVNIDSFSIENRKFKKYYNNFYEVLFNGIKISLLVKYETNIVEGMFNPIDGTKEKSRFKIIDDYYTYKNGSILKFIPSKKSMSSIFVENENEIKKFIKENKLSRKKETDLIKLFAYYNQL